MIVTVTPNPCIDRTIRVDCLTPGELNRAYAAMSEAGGKGINVSRALATESVPTVAVLPLASRSAVQYLALLGECVKVSAVPIEGEIRVNSSIIDASGRLTKVNEPGPQMAAVDADELLAAAASATRSGWLVGCGSLPPGAPRDFYARLAKCGTRDLHVAVDTSGDALAAALEADPALVKPNRSELEEVAGRRLERFGDAIEAARQLLSDAGAVLLSLGADGALYVDQDRAAHAEAKIGDALNPVGAGDALLAGFLAAGARMESLGTAVAWAVAKLRSPGTRMRAVTEADRAAVIVHPHIDLTRRLTN